MHSTTDRPAGGNTGRLFLAFGGPVCADQISNCPLDRVLTYKNLIYLLNLQIYLGLIYYISKNKNLSLGLAFSILVNILALVVDYLILVVNFVFRPPGFESCMLSIHQPEYNLFQLCINMII